MTADVRRVYQAVGVLLQRSRATLGWSQARMAQSLGVSRPTYIAMERGRAPITLDRLFACAALFSCSYTALIPDEGVHALAVPVGRERGTPCALPSAGSSGG